MHFSIPDTEQVRSSESTYTVFKVYVNGKYHASLRYSAFLTLHQSFAKSVGSKRPEFPPKRLLPLSPNQLQERRIGLEKYMQTVVGLEEVCGSELLCSFLRSAQHETNGVSLASRNLDVFLPNGQKRNLTISNNAPTSALLKLMCEDLGLLPELLPYFALFLFRRDPDGLWRVVGKLEEWECPSITLDWMGAETRIVVRKGSWEAGADEKLMKDPVGLHLLYVQAVSDIERGWVIVGKEDLQSLAKLQSQGRKAEYVVLARGLKFYGSLQFRDCETQLASPMTIYIGNREMCFLGPNREELVFKVTRIKCWRISLDHEKEGGCKVELSFQYLAGKDKLEWLSVISDQGVLMGLCLQEMVQEMMISKAESDKKNGEEWYRRRNGESVESVRSCSELVLGRRPSSRLNSKENIFAENSAFAGIGDDDL